MSAHSYMAYMYDVFVGDYGHKYLLYVWIVLKRDVDGYLGQDLSSRVDCELNFLTFNVWNIYFFAVVDKLNFSVILMIY